MSRLLRRLSDAVKRWTSEADTGHESVHDDPHVGQKSSDESAFGRPTGAEQRRERPDEPGQAGDDRSSSG